jgi:toluene monooxygenase electron transfer component
MSVTVQIDGGEAFAFPPEEDTLLRAGLRAGADLPHECSVGGCGACRFDLLSGEMERLWPEAPGLSERDRKRGKYLACQSRPLTDCTIKLRTSAEYHPVVPARRRMAKLVERRLLTRDMAEFSFHTGGAAAFLPGQYALLYPQGVAGARAYSMSNLANQGGAWQFIIRRTPSGRGSAALFELAEGDEIPLDGPYGHAYFRADSPREIVCIAGGSGLAPMLGIARAALPRTVWFFDGARTSADLCGGELLGEVPGLTYRPVLSLPDSGWTGATGFVHEEVARALPAPLDQYEYYFAGPPPMIEAIQSLLMVQHRVPFTQIHFDRFV